MTKNIDAKDVSETAFCVSSVDGHKLHEVIYQQLSNECKVNISLAHVRRLTTAFLNSALGQLYNEFSYDVVDSYVQFSGGSPQFLSLVDRVRKRAKAYFSATTDTVNEIKNTYPDD
ncbi:DUF4325 domain-containing protein [Nisaea sp.]|uniref:STAS-like domain-containing protein n=1 Tax=Nisaea sp. TaxID=2024842 RepID=UPI00329805C7